VGISHHREILDPPLVIWNTDKHGLQPLKSVTY